MDICSKPRGVSNDFSHAKIWWDGTTWIHIFQHFWDYSASSSIWRTLEDPPTYKKSFISCMVMCQYWIKKVSQMILSLWAVFARFFCLASGNIWDIGTKELFCASRMNITMTDSWHWHMYLHENHKYQLNVGKYAMQRSYGIDFIQPTAKVRKAWWDPIPCIHVGPSLQITALPWKSDWVQKRRVSRGVCFCPLRKPKYFPTVIVSVKTYRSALGKC